VPLHSHPDVETFFPLSAEVEGLTERAGRLEWIAVRPGDVFHVPGGAPHAWRNRGREPAVTIIATTSRIARFFREVATPPGPPSEAAIRRFLEVSARYGYWNATPENNARVGLPPPA
jgi:hypothetical protein